MKNEASTICPRCVQCFGSREMRNMPCLLLLTFSWDGRIDGRLTFRRHVSFSLTGLPASRARRGIHHSFITSHLTLPSFSSSTHTRILQPRFPNIHSLRVTVAVADALNIRAKTKRSEEHGLISLYTRPSNSLIYDSES